MKDALTSRDLFAMAALVAMIGRADTDPMNKNIVKNAYAIADEMIALRGNRSPGESKSCT